MGPLVGSSLKLRGDVVMEHSRVCNVQGHVMRACNYQVVSDSQSGKRDVGDLSS